MPARLRVSGQVPGPLLSCLVVAVLYGKAVGFWWTWDELTYLKTVVTQPLWRVLFVPSVYQEFSRLFFFPGVLLSFEIDYLIAGVGPAFYFLHQLAALAVSAALLAFLARRWLAPGPALLAAPLFLAGPAIPGVVAELMTRHYIDGLVLALASTLSFVLFLEMKRRRFLVASVLAYFLAAACKEVYVPLPAVLLVLPVATLRERLRALVPLGLAGLVYLAWRQTMLAGFFGAYTADATDLGVLGTRVRLLGTQLLDVALSPRGTPGAVAAVLAGLLALVPLLFRPRTLGLASVLALAVALPQLPVAERLEPRFGFLPWLLVAVLVAWSSGEWLEQGRAGTVAAAVLVAATFVLALPANRSSWNALEARDRRSRAQGTFLLETAGDGDAFFSPGGDPTFQRNLAWLRKDILRRPGTPRVVYDEMSFCEPAAASLRVFSFSDTSGRVEPLAAGPAGLCADVRARTRQVPLSIHVSYERGTLRWEFGPHTTGSWAFVHGDEDAVVALPASGGLALAGVRTLNLRVRYESPEGWRAYSDRLQLVVKDGRADLHWKTPGEEPGR
jgi:hypothetical protein